MKNRNWTKEDLILTFNLYLKLPFGKMHKGNVDVIKLAGLIDRTPSSIAMRLGNYASVDPFHMARGIKGLNGGDKQVRPIWDEFNANREDLLFESERILAGKQEINLEEKFSQILCDLSQLKGLSKERMVKTRINQNIFRQIVLANYSFQCAITGINVTELLTASHIIPWAANEQERLNPANGICLSPLFDKAFDKGLIGISQDYKIILSNHIKEKQMEPFYYQHFEPFAGKTITLPMKYKPNIEFLDYHLSNIYLG